MERLLVDTVDVVGAGFLDFKVCMHIFSIIITRFTSYDYTQFFPKSETASAIGPQSLNVV